MQPKHFKAFLNEAANIVNTHKTAGNDIIDSLYFAKQFLESVKINVSDTQILEFAKEW